MKVLGLMSGTSMDGLDCCFVDIKISDSYHLEFNVFKTKTFEYSTYLKNNIKKVIKNKNSLLIAKVNDELGEFFLKSSCDILKKNNVKLISLHGQTISHVDGLSSKQIGNPKFLSDFFKVPIIYDFRKLDIILGGRGAPLIPFLDWLLFKDLNQDTVTLNIGGISNITYIPKKSKRNDIIGFDTGPGMCLIDQYVLLKFREKMDFNAKLSNKGIVNKELLNYLMNDKYIFLKPPKSTSVEKYNMQYLCDLIKKYKFISSEDFIRTLVNYTAKSINSNIKMFLKFNSPYQLIVSGGGTNHPLLMQDLKKNIDALKIEKFSFNKINHNFKESLLMAVMGYTFFNKIPNNMKNVTGAKKKATYGVLYE